MSKVAAEKVDKDLEFLSHFFKDPQLWNDNDKALFYQVQTKSGLSHYQMAKINKFGLRVFSCMLLSPINGESYANILFIRRLRA